MRLVILLALALVVTGVALVPSAGAVCDGDTKVDRACQNTVCTVKSLDEDWTIKCWNIIGP